jgi:glycosyltransferase involved in cell wall biosynthesis
MRLDPQFRRALAVLWRQLGIEALDVLFGRSLLTLDRASLGEITGSPFWRHVLLPLDAPAGVPPLFDTAFYLQQPGIDLQRLAPLAHYVLVGAGEGRNPHPLFNTAWYLSHNPDVVASGTNPLLHFANRGGPEGRSPHPAVRADWYRSIYEGEQTADAAPRAGPSPIADRRYSVRETTVAHPSKPALKRPIICVAHVLPSRPRAGNEYRISRLLEWLAGRGHAVILVVAPLESEEPDAVARSLLFKKYPQALVCCRDGTLFVSTGALSRSVAALHGKRIGDASEKHRARGTERDLSGLEHHFCHDALIGVLMALGGNFPDAVYYINYAFMTRFLPYLSAPPVSFVDTHDVLSDKAAKVGAFGVSDNVSISAAEEGAMLRRGSAVLAIQRDEAVRLATLAPHTPVLTVGVDFAASDVGLPPEQPEILVVAHSNPLNIKGVQDFLRFAWPSIRAARPDARFVVVGSVAESVRYPDPQVHLAGVVEDLAAYYGRARVVINPSVAGTGLKIKTVESIAYFRPIVTFPAGVEGITEPLLTICHVARDWYEFAGKVIALLDPVQGMLSAGERQIIKDVLEPSAVYKELDGWLTGLEPAAA